MLNPPLPTTSLISRCVKTTGEYKKSNIGYRIGIGLEKQEVSGIGMKKSYRASLITQ